MEQDLIAPSEKMTEWLRCAFKAQEMTTEELTIYAIDNIWLKYPFQSMESVVLDEMMKRLNERVWR